MKFVLSESFELQYSVVNGYDAAYKIICAFNIIHFFWKAVRNSFAL